MAATNPKSAWIEQYAAWTEGWALQLAFSITQSIEKAERIVADGVLALSMTRGTTATEFAEVIWELASKEAYRGFGPEPFFRMPAVARAAVVLKLRAKLNRAQIARALGLELRQVDDHLENARLLFSEGRSWIGSGPDVHLEGEGDQERWVPNCSQWSSDTPIQDIFAQYIGRDLDRESETRLYAHLVDCEICRRSFASFKKNYASWEESVPFVDCDPTFRKHLRKTAKSAVRLEKRSGPSPWPGMRRLWTDAQMRAVLFAALALAVFRLLVSKH